MRALDYGTYRLARCYDSRPAVVGCARHRPLHVVRRGGEGMLIAAAAERFGVSPAIARRKARVSHARPESASFGELATAAAN